MSCLQLFFTLNHLHKKNELLHRIWFDIAILEQTNNGSKKPCHASAT